MNSPIKRWAEDMHTDGQQTHEKMLNITITREMQIKTTMRYHFKPVRWLKSTTQETTGVAEVVKKEESSCTVGGNANWCSHSGKQHGGSSKS